MENQNKHDNMVFITTIVAIVAITTLLTLCGGSGVVCKNQKTLWFAFSSVVMVVFVFFAYLSYTEISNQKDPEKASWFLFAKVSGWVGIFFVLLYLMFIPIYFYQLLFTAKEDGKTFNDLLLILLSFLMVVGVGIYKFIYYLIDKEVTAKLDAGSKKIDDETDKMENAINTSFTAHKEEFGGHLITIDGKLKKVEEEVDGKARREELKIAEATSAFAMAFSFWKQYIAWINYYSPRNIEKIRRIDVDHSVYEKLDEEGIRHHKGVLDEAIRQCKRGHDAIKEIIELEDTHKESKSENTNWLEKPDFKNLVIKTKNNYAVFLATKASHNGGKCSTEDRRIALVLSKENYDEIKNIEITENSFVSDKDSMTLIYVQKATQVLVWEIFLKGAPEEEEAKTILKTLFIQTDTDSFEKLKKALQEERTFIGVPAPVL
jgi:hypothetical protein